MADQKISQLSSGGAAQATDDYVIARSGANYKVSGANVAAAATSVGTLSSLTVGGKLTVNSSSEVAKFGSTSAVNAYVAFARDSTTLGYVGNAGGIMTGGGATDFGITSTGSRPLVFGTADLPRMTLDASGNLGLGVTPSAWASSRKAVQVGTSEGVFVSAGTYGFFSTNCYLDTLGSYRRINAGYAQEYRQWNDGTHQWMVTGTSTANSTISFTTAMTLDASGNLGVGATSSSVSFDTGTSGTARTVLRLDSTGTTRTTENPTLLLFNGGTVTQNQMSRIAFSSGSGALSNVIGADITAIFTGDGTGNGRSTALVFSTADQTVAQQPTERARITSGGYFKASNTGTYLGSTGEYHEMRSDITAANGVLFVHATSASATSDGIIQSRASRNTTDNTFYAFSYYNDAAAAYKFRIADSGTATNTTGTYGTISDIKHKQDIVDAPSQWDDLKAVRFRKFRMKSDVAANPDAPYMLGVVAQELEQTSPGLVDEHPDFEEQEVTDEDGNVTTEKVQVGTTKSVKSSILLMKAAVALQEAMARIEALEARLEALEA